MEPRLCLLPKNWSKITRIIYENQRMRDDNKFNSNKENILRFTYFRVSVEVVPRVAVAAHHTAGELIDAVLELAVRPTFWNQMLGYTYNRNYS